MLKPTIYRNYYCGELSENEIEKEVKLSGWIANIRDHGGVIFLDLRDETGVIQLVSNDDSIFTGLTKESTITVDGCVRKRSEDDYNDHIKTGKIEVVVEKIEVQGKALNNLPFEIVTSTNVNEEVRLKYRYLDLRNEKVHNMVKFRSNLLKYLRNKMDSLEFTEVQTPIITASSPEGARDFIIPSRKFQGKFYALPQAPQQFKQLLMVGGFNKYYQIAPCFRDEDTRADRSLEFYQLDFEMSFVTEEDVYDVGEEIFYDTFTKFTNKEVSPRPFRRISFKESMEKYGTDKPDLRNPLYIIDISEVFTETEFKPFRGSNVKAIKVSGIASKSNSWFNDVVDYAKTIGMPGIGYISILDGMVFKGPIDKFLTEEDKKTLIEKAELKEEDVLFFIADRNEKVALKQAGLIRTYLGEKLELIDKNKYEFCIINDFPMFEYDEENKKYEFCHNPFSMPKGGIKAYENPNLDEIEAYQFDFVCNGYEMASGAVRNHDIECLEKGFEMVGYSKEVVKERFGALYNAFQYGVPPHAGMAPGIERMIMLLTDETNLREVITFPTSASGEDKMMGAPCTLDEKQLREVHIKLR